VSGVSRGVTKLSRAANCCGGVHQNRQQWGVDRLTSCFRSWMLRTLTADPEGTVKTLSLLKTALLRVQTAHREDHTAEFGGECPSLYRRAEVY
jgi:hypothetical protein